MEVATNVEPKRGRARVVWGLRGIHDKCMTVQLYILEEWREDRTGSLRGDDLSGIETRWEECPACTSTTPSTLEGCTIVHRCQLVDVDQEEAGSTSSARSNPRARSRHAGHAAQPGR